MTNNPGPPPGSPDLTSAPGPPPGMPGTEVPEPEPETKSRTWLIVLVLAVGAFVLFLVLGVIALLLTGGSSASAEYCAAAERLNDQIALNDGNIDQLRFVVQQGGELAPSAIADQWVALDQALIEIDGAASAAETAEAGAKADTASDAIFQHSVDSCS